MTMYNDIFGITPKNKGAGINSKNKGDRNENLAAKFLSLWVGSVFKRVPRSGGLGDKMPSLSGDVLDLSGKFLFCVETKHYKYIPIEGVLRNNTKIKVFWAQTIRDAERSGKFPLLMFRNNGMPKMTYIMYFNKSIASIIIDIFLLKPISIFEDVYGFKSEEVIGRVDYKKFSKLLKI
jgi:hypothetical protein